MFNVGPMELLVLAVVGLIVLGPDKLPDLARDAARMIRTLRDLATGARAQLREELGPEFADVDLRSLHPRTAIQRAVLGDDIDLRKLDPRAAIQRTIMGEDTPAAGGVPLTKDNGSSGATDGTAAPRFDSDAT
ncbi:MAG TPA: sec-independent translocase [Jatrophihabitantaceae bacterium]|nr:sec-independent translocase [Jatrophihabitantaceae bacterium]